MELYFKIFKNIYEVRLKLLIVMNIVLPPNIF